MADVKSRGDCASGELCRCQALSHRLRVRLGPSRRVERSVQRRRQHLSRARFGATSGSLLARFWFAFGSLLVRFWFANWSDVVRFSVNSGCEEPVEEEKERSTG